MKGLPGCTTHDARQDIYARFLGHVRLLLDWIDEMRTHPEVAPEECETSLGSDLWRRQGSRLASEINIIGSRKAVRDAYALRTWAFAWFAYRQHLRVLGRLYKQGLAGGVPLDGPAENDSDDAAGERTSEKDQTFRLLMERAAKECLSPMRVDLGAPKAEGLAAYDFGYTGPSPLVDPVR